MNPILLRLREHPVWHAAVLALLLGACLALVCWPSPGQARIPRPVAFDVMLLRSDCLLFGTISHVRPVPDRDDVFEIVLHDPNVVATRWEAPPESFRVRGTLFTSEKFERLSSPMLDFALVTGERYLFFLRGGPWAHAPFVAGPYAYYPLNHLGHVQCDDRGLVYGLGPGGFVCSRPEQQFGAPLAEPALTQILRTSLSNARDRRPSTAAELEETGRPLWRLPEEL